MKKHFEDPEGSLVHLNQDEVHVNRSPLFFQVPLFQERKQYRLSPNPPACLGPGFFPRRMPYGYPRCRGLGGSPLEHGPIHAPVLCSRDSGPRPARPPRAWGVRIAVRGLRLWSQTVLLRPSPRLRASFCVSHKDWLFPRTSGPRLAPLPPPRGCSWAGPFADALGAVRNSKIICEARETKRQQFV